MLISISCLQLSHVWGISWTHAFSCTTEFEDHQGCIAATKVVLITVHTHLSGSYTTDTKSGCSPLPFPSASALFTPTFCLLQNHFWTRGILPGHHRYKTKSGSLCVMLVESMLDPAALTSLSLYQRRNYAAESQIVLGAWPSFFRGHIILVVEKQSDTTSLVLTCGFV